MLERSTSEHPKRFWYLEGRTKTGPVRPAVTVNYCIIGEHILCFDIVIVHVRLDILVEFFDI